MRCAELVNDLFRRDVDTLQELFERKLTQIKEKYLPGPLSEGYGRGFQLEKAGSYMKNQIHETSERIANLFLRAGLGLRCEADKIPTPRRTESEYEERLRVLESEARQEICRLRSECQERARGIDVYDLHPNLKDIHMVRSAILWMPMEEL